MYSMCFSSNCSMSGLLGLVFFSKVLTFSTPGAGGLRRSPAEVAEALGGKYRGKAEVGGDSFEQLEGSNPWMYPKINQNHPFIDGF